MYAIFWQCRTQARIICTALFKVPVSILLFTRLNMGVNGHSHQGSEGVTGEVIGLLSNSHNISHTNFAMR